MTSNRSPIHRFFVFTFRFWFLYQIALTTVFFGTSFFPIRRTEVPSAGPPQAETFPQNPLGEQIALAVVAFNLAMVVTAVVGKEVYKGTWRARGARILVYVMLLVNGTVVVVSTFGLYRAESASRYYSWMVPLFVALIFISIPMILIFLSRAVRLLAAASLPLPPACDPGSSTAGGHPKPGD